MVITRWTLLTVTSVRITPLPMPELKNYRPKGSCSRRHAVVPFLTSCILIPSCPGRPAATFCIQQTTKLTIPSCLALSLVLPASPSMKEQKSQPTHAKPMALFTSPQLPLFPKYHLVNTPHSIPPLLPYPPKGECRLEEEKITHSARFVLTRGRVVATWRAHGPRRLYIYFYFWEGWDLDGCMDRNFNIIFLSCGIGGLLCLRTLAFGGVRVAQSYRSSVLPTRPHRGKSVLRYHYQTLSFDFLSLTSFCLPDFMSSPRGFQYLRIGARDSWIRRFVDRGLFADMRVWVEGYFSH